MRFVAPDPPCVSMARCGLESRLRHTDQPGEMHHLARLSSRFDDHRRDLRARCARALDDCAPGHATGWDGAYLVHVAIGEDHKRYPSADGPAKRRGTTVRSARVIRFRRGVEKMGGQRGRQKNRPSSPARFSRSRLVSSAWRSFTWWHWLCGVSSRMLARCPM